MGSDTTVKIGVREIAGIVVLGLIISTGMSFFMGGQSPVKEGDSGSGVDQTVTVSGTEYSFSPSTISVKKGQKIRIEFTNTGQIPHNLRIPDLDTGTETIEAGQTDSFTFVAPKTGTFPIDFECTLPGHASNGMTGTLQTG